MHAERRHRGYKAFGLGIDSTMPLLAPVEHTGPVDVRVELEPLAAAVGTAASASAHVAWTDLSPEGGRFEVRGLACFEATLSRILIRHQVAPGHPLLEPYLIGRVLPFLVSLRGGFPLHASAVAIEGRAAAFVGGSTAGKSSLAAALVAAGHHFVADDIAAISRPDQPVVEPAHPELKVSREVVAATSPPFDSVRPFPGSEERVLRLASRFVEAALPMARIYFLSPAEGSDCSIEEVSPSAACTLLVSNYFGLPSIGRRLVGLDNILDLAGRIAGAVDCRRVFVPRQLGRLTDVARRVEGDLGS